MLVECSGRCIFIRPLFHYEDNLLIARIEGAGKIAQNKYTEGS